MQAARAVVRPMVTRPQGSRNFIDAMVNKPNTVAQERLPFIDPSKAHLHGMLVGIHALARFTDAFRVPFVGADNPTYLKGDGDAMFFYAGAAFQGFLVLQLARGLYNMSNGVGKS